MSFISAFHALLYGNTKKFKCNIQKVCEYLDQLETQLSTLRDHHETHTLKYKLLRQTITVLTADCIQYFASIKHIEGLQAMLTTGVCCEDEMITVIGIYHPEMLREIVGSIAQLRQHILAHSEEYRKESERQNIREIIEIINEHEIDELCIRMKMTKTELKTFLSSSIK